MKKIAILLTSVVLIGVICFVFLSDILQYNTGVVTNITAKTSNEDNLELKIAYFLPMGGYFVRDVAEDEGEYCGDGVRDYDGSLGKYRIMIEFGDVEPHKSFAKRENKDGIFEIKNSVGSLKAKIVHPSDHGFVLYVGSDEQIYVESSGGYKLNDICGVIKIPIIVGDK
ncbi:MAG: hypothetical protein IKB86_02620 [Clostridia bacterium]|nr:hypothetical protein [Clostridia bacterium]